MNSTLGDSPGILLVRFSSLGDVVLATAAAANVKAAIPGARVTFLTGSAYAPLFEGHPAVDRIAAFGGTAGGETIPDLYRFCRGLGGFDVVVDLHGTARSRLASSFLSARRRIRYSKSSLMRRLWTMGWMRGRMAAEERHVVDRYLAVLEKIGVPAGPMEPQIVLSDEERGKARSLLRESGMGNPEKAAVLVPGARWPNKEWTGEGFAAVGEWLAAERGLELVIAGSGADGAAVDRLKGILRVPATDISGRTGLRELAAVLAGSRVVIGNDSGPGHIAAAVGTPVVTLFGPTSEAFGFAPRGERSVAVSLPLDCRPCSLHGGSRCRRGKRECLDGLETGPVVEAVRKVLDGP
jgi:heptosyltransferase-2